jgi:hypothetical protein
VLGAVGCSRLRSFAAGWQKKREGKVVEFYNYDDVRTVRCALCWDALLVTDPKNPQCCGQEQMSRKVKSGLDWIVLYVRPSEYTRPEKNCTH